MPKQLKVFNRFIFDYHADIDSKTFFDWFKNALNHLPKNSVVIMDNASIHNTRLPGTPKSKTDATNEQINDNKNETYYRSERKLFLTIQINFYLSKSISIYLYPFLFI